MTGSQKNDNAGHELWIFDDDKKFELFKAEIAKEVSHSIASFQNANMAGASAMKAAMLINGGAAVAILAFIGSALEQKQNAELIKSQCHSMACFVFATLLVAIAFGLSYISACIINHTALKCPTPRKWYICNYAASVLVVVSYILYLFAAWRSYAAFTGSL